VQCSIEIKCVYKKINPGLNPTNKKTQKNFLNSEQILKLLLEMLTDIWKQFKIYNWLAKPKDLQKRFSDFCERIGEFKFF
jgi:hypothetical protein